MIGKGRIMKSEVIWQRVEGMLIFLTGIWVYNSLGGNMPWWLSLPVFFAPDLVLVAYIAGPRIGAFGYNACIFMAWDWYC